MMKTVRSLRPGDGEAGKHAGALSLTDARILAFPVRSLKGVFAWVTCPAVLGRLNRDLKLGDSANELALPSAPGKDKTLWQQRGPLLVDGKSSWCWRSLSSSGRGSRCGPRLDCQHAVEDEFTRKRLQSHLVDTPRRRLHPFRPPRNGSRRPRRPGL